MLSVAKIDLTWADDQYLSTLFKLIRELNKVYTPKKKEKVKAKDMAKFIQ